ncbi:MAG: hypothetical protein JWO05_2571 [Gemmatimonadetes bacterium]|nr:hypothetical protein [Gemmatimonadota bacterium]
MDAILKDIRYALRTLARSPGYTAIAIGCLALGIGANTTIFSAVNTMILRPLEFEQPERLVRVYQTAAKHDMNDMSLSVGDFEDFKAGTSAFENFSIFDTRSFAFSLDTRSVARPLQGATVSWDMFNTLRVKPAMGRDFRAEEAVAGRNHVAIISDFVWHDSFHGDRNVIGKQLVLDGTPHEIIGVLPPLLRFPDTEQVWTPLAFSGPVNRGNHGYDGIARLRGGATMEQASSQLAKVAKELEVKYPDSNTGMGTRVLDYKASLVEDYSALVWTMLGAVGFVLLIACANVANLLLARATGRSREIAVRTALGARRAQLVRQLLVESVMVALAGSTIGLLIAVWGLDTLVANIPYELPYWMVFDIDRSVLTYTLLLAVGTGILFGLAPALQATNPNLQKALRDGGRGASGGGSRQRMRSVLVVAEVAMSLVLLVGASLMMRSFVAMQRVTPGFRTDNVLAVTALPPRERYPDFATIGPLYSNIRARVGTIPSVKSVAAVTSLPLSGSNSSFTIDVEGRPQERGQELLAETKGIEGPYFQLLDIPVVDGRAFTADEERDSTRNVVIVNRTMAEKLWPGRSSLGMRVRGSGDSTWSTVVGVVGDTKMRKLSDPAQLQLYFPHSNFPRRAMTLVIRTGGNPATVGAALRTTMQQVDPSIALDEMQSMSVIRDRSMWESRVFGSMFMIFGGVALLLAVVGIYGVMAYAVGQRTHEIGIRMALGAAKRDVLSLVVSQGARLAGFGVVIGIVLALVVTRLLRNQLFGVSPTDLLSFSVIALLLGGTALLASWIPARRAASVDPMVALRHE